MPKLLLLDGHSLAYRAFFALPADLQTAGGTFTNAVYGFTSMLAKVLGDERPDLVAVSFDTGLPAFRVELDPEYKANRAKAPETFSAQMPLIREVLETVHIPMVEIAGVEADDVIATLARHAADEGIDVVIVTGDRDAYQVVHDPHVKVLYNKRGVSDYALYDEAGIEERTGVRPEQYVDYASLRGDTSDNLPGVPGVGEKTAAKLIQTYGDLDAIYEHLDELTPKQRENLEANRERVFVNREMIRLRDDVDVGVEPAELRIGGFDGEAVRNLFNQLEFRSLLPRLMDAIGDRAVASEAAAEAEVMTAEVTVARGARAARAAIEAVGKAGARYALEPRWAGTPGRSELAGLAIAGSSDAATFLDADLLAAEAPRAALSDLLGEGGPPLVVHRAKELMHGLGALGGPYDGALGVEVADLELDTAVMAYLLDPADGRYALDDLAARHLGIELTSPDTEPGTLDLDGTAEAEEAGRRATAVLRLGGVLEKALADRELTELYERIERPLVRVLYDMERTGILIDRPFLEELRSDLASQAEQLERRIHSLAGESFTINSVPQLRRILFEKLGLTPVKKTKTGPSTDADSLQKLAEEHPIVEELLRYREVEKLRSTYADALPPLIAADGRVHATFNQTATTTGRISSENPNLQNVPVRTAGGRELRRAFVAGDGRGLLCADYSQIELRVLAHLAEDPGLIDAFERRLDVHTVTAARVFGVGEADVTGEQRRFAKVVNYGLAYGMEAYGLGQRAGIPTEEAREVLDSYFASFPNVHDYMEHTVREARDRGYTTTMFGRRRQVAELASDNFRIRQMGERMAQNAPVQGSAADVFKLAMIDVDRAIAEHDLGARMLLTVHDEIVFEVPVGERDEAEGLIRSTMESVVELRVPLEVDLGFGPNWADAKA